MPGKPGVPEIHTITDTTAEISWTAPESDGGAPITSYRVEYIRRGDKQWVPVDTNKPEQTFTITDLLTEANYMFRVSATNKVKHGIISSMYVYV